MATIDEIREHNYALTQGRCVGSADLDNDDEAFDEKMQKLVNQLQKQFKESTKLELDIDFSFRYKRMTKLPE